MNIPPINQGAENMSNGLPRFDPWAAAPAWAFELRDTLASHSLKLDKIEGLVRDILTTPRLVVRLGQPTDKEIS